MASLNKSTTAPPSHSNSTTNLTNSARPRQERVFLHCQLVVQVFNVSILSRVLAMLQRKHNKRWDCSGKQNNQAICHRKSLGSWPGKIPHNHLVVAATSNPPIPSLQPVAGGDQKKQQQQRKASNSQQVFLSSKIELPFDWKRKEDDELSVTVVANLLSLTHCSN